MIRKLIISFILVLSMITTADAAVRVDFDYKGATLAEAAYTALAQAESFNNDEIVEILKHYTSAEFASAGIWTSKFLERKSLKDAGLFSSAENKYYKAIRFIVERRIIPRIIRIGGELLHHPEQFLYWGPYIFKTCEDVMNLCAQFETIVANGKISFSDIQFPQLNPALQEYYNLAKLGNINWQEAWDRITNIPTPSWEDFREDFKLLFDQISPVNLAAAGEDAITGRVSHIFDRFSEAPQNIPDLLDRVQEAFTFVSSGAAIKEILEGVIGDLKDSLAVEKLFNLGNYNIGAYVNDYVNQLKGTYYTQQWIIYHYGDDSQGGEEPSEPYYTQVYNINITFIEPLSNTVITRLAYTEEYDSRKEDKSVFEDRMNQKAQTYKTGKYLFVTVNPETPIYYGGSGSTGTGVAGPDGKIIDYEDLFDSRVNSEVVWEKEFEQRRKTLEDTIEYPLIDSPRIQFYVEKGEKHYYDVTSAESVQNTGTASFSVSCHDQVEIVKSGFNFKVNERYNSSKLNEYAYPKGRVTQKEAYDVSLFEQKIDELESKIEINNQEIEVYRQQIREIQAVADTTTNLADRQQLLTQISTLNIKINNLNYSNRNLQDQINAVNKAMDDYAVDYNEDLGGSYRIPNVENDLAGDFRIHWDGPGTWSGHTYARLGHIVGMEDPVKFVAEVKQERGETWFLGIIRIKRAIVGVDYKLVSEHESSDIVDVIKFDADMPAQRKADLINERRSQIQQEYPSCQVEVIRNEPESLEKDSPDEPMHLLWMSDRIAIARSVEYRLRQIDGQLAFIERNLFIKKNVLKDYLNAFLRPVPRWRTSTPAGAALQRWLDAGTGNVAFSNP